MSPHGRSSPMTIIAWIAIALGIVWLVALGGGFYGIYGSELRVVSVVLAAVALATWGVVAVRRPSWRPRSAISPAFALPLAAFALTTLTSERPRVSVEYLGYAVVLVALYLLLRALMAHPGFRDRVSGFTVPLALGIGIAFVAACVGHWVDWWSAIGAVRVPPLRPFFESLTYGNPSAVMTISVLLTAAAVAHVGVATRARQALVAGLVVLAAAVTLLSGSRAGWLAVALAALVVGIGALASPGGRGALRAALRTRAARVTALAVLVVGVGAALVAAPAVLLRAGAGGEDLRVTYLAVAGRMFAGAPLTGVGAGGWVAGRIAATADGETDYYIPHAHDLYAQTAAEHGLLGIAAGGVAIAWLAWLILGGLRDPSPARRRWAWAALFGTAYFGAHQLLDFYANMPAALFAFALPIAWLDATASRAIALRPPTTAVGRDARRILRGAAAAAAVGVLGVAAVGLVAQEAPAQAMSAGRVAAAAGDWSAALPLFRSAALADPSMPAYAFARGLAEAREGERATALESIAGVATTDDLPVAWLDVAALRLDGGDEAGSRVALEGALRLGRQQPAVLFAAGALLERLGDAPAADAAWAATLRMLPSLAADSWWAEPSRASRWPGIRDTALAGMPPDAAADLWLSSGDTAMAAASAAMISDPAARERTRLAVAAWDGSPADRAALDAFARAHPFDLVAVAWAGRVAARVGDGAAVERYRRWADVVTGGASAAVGEIVVAAPEATDADAGLNGTFWGQYTYRRATPADQLVPSLPHLRLAP